jgi:hypothetical protein
VPGWKKDEWREQAPGLSLVPTEKGTRTRRSILERRGFFGCDMNTVANNAQKRQKFSFLQTPHSQREPPGVHGEEEKEKELLLNSRSLPPLGELKKN